MKKTFFAIVALAMMALSSVASAAAIAYDKVGTFVAEFAYNYSVANGFLVGANVLTDLAADIYRAADVVGRELVGILPSITVNSGSEAAALGDTVRSHFTRTPTVGTVTPSMTIPEGTDQTVDNKTLTIDTTASVQIPWTGEDMKHVGNGAGFETIYGDQIAQAMRAITNQMEAAAWAVGYKAASRAYGTSGTTPFASNFNEVAEVRQILVDNGMPMDGMATLAINTAAGTKMRNLAQLQKVSESGSSSLLRQGELLNLQNLMLKESAGIGIHTKGTGASYTTDGSAYAVGATAITVITGTGTVLAGDVVTFAGDTNQYVAESALSGGVVTLAAPGLRVAIAASATAMTVTNSYTGNLAFHKSAIEIAVRPLADPKGGDAAVDKMLAQDPWSGMIFEVAAYRGFKKAMFMVSTVYGLKAWKSQHIANLKG